jgi:hypothetical protein
VQPKPLNANFCAIGLSLAISGLERSKDCAALHEPKSNKLESNSLSFGYLVMVSPKKNNDETECSFDLSG